MNNYKERGKRLREARERVKLTQAELAILTGYDESYISHYERGDRVIDLKKAKLFADCLGTNVDYIMCGDEPQLSDNVLMACPFCGSRAVLDTNGNALWVICLGCGTTTAKTFFTGKRGQKIVADRWNRRVTNENC